jgi:hypothetical protein
MSRYGAPYPHPSYGHDVEMPASSGVVEDFAFADTVVASGDLEEVAPPSGVIVADGAGQPMLVPLAYTPHDVPAVMAPPPMGLWERLRHGVMAMREELNQLWTATACLEEIHDGNGVVIRDEDPFVRAATVGRRVRRLFSFFEWDRADLLRAAWIGLAVFVLVATVGAICLQMGSAPDAADRASLVP